MSGRIVNVRPKPGFVMDGAGVLLPSRQPGGFMVRDGLANVMSGMGTTADRRSYAGYNFWVAQPAQVEAAYRTSWLMRKIIDAPATDMTRTWRAWQTDRDIIEKLEKEEKRLRLKAKCKRALTLARLWGGGLIVIGVKGQGADPMLELKPEQCKKGGLTYLRVFARQQVTVGPEITDLESPWHGEPEYYSVTPVGGTAIKIHPSRVAAFIGQPTPEGSTMSVEWFWGDPLYQSIENALQNADLSQDGFATLIDEAKLDIIKIPGLMDNVASDEYESRLLKRLQLVKTGQSLWRAKVIDGKEDWEQRQITWTGMPDILIAFLQMVAGAADIPITRLLGTSPKGLQSTGEGEEKDYHAMIEAKQDEMLAPALDRIDQFLIRSALGDFPDDIWYRFNPLVRLTPKEASEVEKNRATAVKIYSDTGLFDTTALATIAKNAITESGQWPGSEIAFEEAEAAAGDDDDDENRENDPEASRELVLPEERETLDRKISRRTRPMMKDARDRSLYVSRRLINADELIRWAKAQGFETTQPAEAMHVTIAFSRKPVNWMKVGEDWSSDEDGRVRVKPGGPRTVERLGDKGAVALMFRSDSLEWRHRRIHEEGTGAEWAWPEYQPHVTISWKAPADMDLDKIEPYGGPLVFGPEVFAEVKDDWEKTIVEDSRRGFVALRDGLSLEC